ncbi:DUF7504 family protein [Halorussus lipolyticus]|uniref:DUF7504 family protein n=1 Tax=Halorussus lipolyticus TaxID=3034024 RepID=UPI0023E7FAD6|nr:hypothetical protein [Halorussus sp. DT80]
MNMNDADSPGEAFRRHLSGLKNCGCNLLVTGDVREEVSHRMTQKLLGAPELPRTRIIGLTDQDRADLPNLLPDDIAPTDEDVLVVDHGCGTRAADVAESPGTVAGNWNRRGIDDLQLTICNTFTTAKNTNSGFDSAELRFSLFTLSYLVSQHDISTVEQFVSAVGDHVRSVSGMGHYHLPLADDSETVQRLAPQFDARIELREKRGLPEQRWHFPELDAPTAWTGL